jgi:hypothetical protein
MKEHISRILIGAVLVAVIYTIAVMFLGWDQYTPARSKAPYYAEWR